MTKIELTSTKDITLKTAGKYCEDDIQINQNLERRAFTPSGEQAILYPSDGHNGISEIVVYKNPTEKVIVQSSDKIQTFTPTEGKFYDEVEVQPIPSGYIIPSGNIDITENKVVDVTQYSQATISVATGGGSGGEDVFGLMLKGTLVDYVDTQRVVTVVEASAMKGMNQYLNSMELPVCTDIGREAFAYYSTNFGLKGLKKASLPVCTSIGQSAFSGCWNLSEIYAPLLVSVGSYAFQNCASLTEIEFENLERIGGSAFLNCNKVVKYSLPNLTYVLSSDKSHFAGNSNLTSFYAPKLSIITESMFGSCNKLVTLSIDYDNVLSVGARAFQFCNSLPSFNAPNCTYISSGAFNLCSSLSTVSLPKVSKMVGGTFTACGIQEIELPMCSSMGTAEFQNCKSLITASLPLITTLGSSTFMSCSSLKNVNLPMCSILQSSAFQNCSTLSFLSLPALTNIRPSVFMNCSSLESLVLASTTMVILSNSNAFTNTPMKSSSYLGRWGSIYVPANLVDSYKTATNWTYYSDRITSIDNLPTT